jgi:phosphoglycerate mutase (EC 5.4.2.1)
MGDRPIVELGEKTPLQAANLPVMDQLALEGQLGRFRMYKLWEKFFPDCSQTSFRKYLN